MCNVMQARASCGSRSATARASCPSSASASPTSTSPRACSSARACGCRRRERGPRHCRRAAMAVLSQGAAAAARATATTPRWRWRFFQRRVAAPPVVAVLSTAAPPRIAVARGRCEGTKPHSGRMTCVTRDLGRSSASDCGLVLRTRLLSKVRHRAANLPRQSLHAAAIPARDQGPRRRAHLGPRAQGAARTLHYITLHYMTLHYLT